MHFLNTAANAVFEQYNARHQDDLKQMRELPPGEGMAIRDQFLLPIGESAGRFLHSLILAREPRRILELGTSYGYSTLFLADAASRVGATVITMDLADYKQAYARSMIEQAGLLDVVDFRCGEAVDMINADPGPFDLVLLDIWKELYVPCLDAFYPKLSEEGVIVADNMIEPEIAREDVRIYRAALSEKPDLHTTLLPIGSGIELSVRWSADNAKL